MLLSSRIRIPPKCVNSIRELGNEDLDIMLLWRDGGDPWGGKR